MTAPFRIVALALVLSGCQQPTAENTAASSNRGSAKPADNYLVRIAKLAPAQQQLVLFRAVRDAGQECQNITKTERLADVEGRALWRVTCRGGGQFAVTIGADGLANVTAPRAPQP